VRFVHDEQADAARDRRQRAREESIVREALGRHESASIVAAETILALVPLFRVLAVMRIARTPIRSAASIWLRISDSRG
jgi:hypothetical protein